MAISEIYNRLPNDDYYQDNRLEVKDEIEALISKVRMIILTKKGDVLGDPEFGVDLEQFIFETFFDRAAIYNEINSQFSKYIPEASKYNLRSIVDTTKGNIIIDILINQERVLGFEI
jgi:phage baseplate assembly protein W